MTTEKPLTARRRLLKAVGAVGGIAAGAKAIPDSWKQPIVDGVLLPAHAQTSDCVSCDLAISMHWETSDDDWDLVIALNGDTLSGKGGNIPCLVHGGDAAPPPPGVFEEVISNSPCGCLTPGNYRIFARLFSTLTAPANEELTGTISLCGNEISYNVGAADGQGGIQPGEAFTIQRFEITPGGSANLL